MGDGSQSVGNKPAGGMAYSRHRKHCRQVPNNFSKTLCATVNSKRRNFGGRNLLRAALQRLIWLRAVSTKNSFKLTVLACDMLRVLSSRPLAQAVRCCAASPRWSRAAGPKASTMRSRHSVPPRVGFWVLGLGFRVFAGGGGIPSSQSAQSTRTLLVRPCYGRWMPGAGPASPTLSEWRYWNLLRRSTEARTVPGLGLRVL